MRLSVVVDNFNYAQYLREVLDSVLPQLAPGDKLIVVDDGSTDASPEILAEYAQLPQVKVLQQANQGQLTALFNGLEAASGELCLLLDSDDYFLPGYLQRLRVLAKAHADIEFFFAATKLGGESLAGVRRMHATLAAMELAEGPTGASRWSTLAGGGIRRHPDLRPGPAAESGPALAGLASEPSRSHADQPSYRSPTGYSQSLPRCRAPVRRWHYPAHRIRSRVRQALHGNTRIFLSDPRQPRVCQYRLGWAPVPALQALSANCPGCTESAVGAASRRAAGSTFGNAAAQSSTAVSPPLDHGAQLQPGQIRSAGISAGQGRRLAAHASPCAVAASSCCPSRALPWALRLAL